MCYKKINDENVGVYKNQPLVLINLGNASGNEIINFAKELKTQYLINLILSSKKK